MGEDAAASAMVAMKDLSPHSAANTSAKVVATMLSAAPGKAEWGEEGVKRVAVDGLEAAALDVGHDIMFRAKPALIGIAAWVASQQRENRHLPLVRPDTTSWASSFSSAAFSSALAALHSSK